MRRRMRVRLWCSRPSKKKKKTKLRTRGSLIVRSGGARFVESARLWHGCLDLLHVPRLRLYETRRCEEEEGRRQRFRRERRCRTRVRRRSLCEEACYDVRSGIFVTDAHTNSRRKLQEKKRKNVRGAEASTIQNTAREGRDACSRQCDARGLGSSRTSTSRRRRRGTGRSAALPRSCRTAPRSSCPARSLPPSPKPPPSSTRWRRTGPAPSSRLVRRGRALQPGACPLARW